MCDVQDEVEFLWGLMSYDDLSSSNKATFDTMNDIELIHWKETDTYSVFIEEAYEFKTPAEKQRYLTALEAAFTAWMEAHGYRTDTLPEPPTETKGHFRSVEAAYADFKARTGIYPCDLCGRAGGRLTGPGDGGFKVLCSEHAQEYMNEALLQGVADINAGRVSRSDYPVGPGWWTLLDETAAKLRSLDPEVQLLFKEKYGTCQIDFITERPEHFNEINRLTEEAEDASRHICEVCGHPGQLREERAWMQTLCDRCAGLDSLKRRKIAEEMKEQYFRQGK